MKNSNNEFNNEDPIELKVKPIGKPIKQEIESHKIENAKNSRLHAYRMMRKKNMTKEELTNFSKINLNEEVLNKDFHQNLYEGIDERSEGSKKDLSLINQFEEYYKEKFKPEHNPIFNDNIQNNLKKKNEFYEIRFKYTLGSNINSNSIVFHKEEKWIAYINQNLVTYI